MSLIVDMMVFEQQTGGYLHWLQVADGKLWLPGQARTV